MTAVDENSTPRHPEAAAFVALLAASARRTPDHPEVAALAEAGVTVAGEYGLSAYIKALISLALSATMTWAMNDRNGRTAILDLGRGGFAFAHNKVEAFRQSGKSDRRAVVSVIRGDRA
jgi:hypothetical protein